MPELDIVAIGANHSETCRWLLDHPDYQGWLNQSRNQQDHGFLWIKGNLSAGKSTIMKFAYSEQVLRASSDETAMAFFFNARGGPMERSPKGMYRSLLHQLLGSDSLPQLRPIFHDSALKPHVRLQLAQTYEQIFSNNPSPTWGIDCLKDLLRVAIDRLAVEQELTIFVDALDECVSEEVQEMVEHFEELGTAAISSQKQLRICFSSRHYPQIEIAHRRELVLELQHGHEQDISAYIENKLRIGLSEGATRIKREVQRKASGVFMWVVLAVNPFKRSITGAACLSWKATAGAASQVE
ncbi:hypothetical protein QC763_311140 [Podospora pseudopauciseta]|uniref:Nephrocystin 3-like N-terminal domain-containing protein n=1 Tax=Podospora pseudopauciseta TaxID=2093780 RepID=A0ABR0HID9_9PEZI|nr:hypothetical protein QC763_311140 [Podospora pseudopauciseta]